MGDGGSPTHTLSNDGDDDYGPIDYQEGLVFLPFGSAINGGDTIELTYTHLAVDYDEIEGNTVDQTIIELKFLGRNKANQEWMRFHAFQANVSTNTDIDMLGGAFAVNSFTGPMETPPGQSAPYKIHWNIQYATP